MSPEAAVALRLQVDASGVGILTLDVPDQTVNTLDEALGEEFAAMLKRIEAHGHLRALVLVSGKSQGFIAGADLRPVQAMEDGSQGESLSRLMQSLTERLSNLSVVTVAAIHGDCLGGGLELALACDARIASDHEATRLGLPEVQLGLLPGGGGTQRLPRLVGLPAALDMMLTGRRLRPGRSREIGLVDALAPPAELEARAVALATRLADTSPLTWKCVLARPLSRLLSPHDWLQRVVLSLGFVRRQVISRARTRVADQTRGHYRAPERILAAVETGLNEGMAAGFVEEARGFGALCVSPESRALVSLFFASTALKKEFAFDESGGDATRIGRIAVIGAGLMGAGIARVSAADAGCDVLLTDRDQDAADAGLARVCDALEDRVQLGRLPGDRRDAIMSRIRAAGPDASLAESDLIIEAVFEDLTLKRSILARVQKEARAVIFASNTSALSIADLARDCEQPQRVLGMHYFSPVERMPLLEVVRTARTDDAVLRACVDLGRRQGKTVVVVNDAPGFYTTRILAPYLNEAARLVSEGNPVDGVDESLLSFGFPLGPLALLDEVGIDVGEKVALTLTKSFGERMQPPVALSGLEADGRQGRKNARGFYQYLGGDGESAGRGPVDTSIYPLLGVAPRSISDASKLAQRCVLLMVNEAVRCLEEGVLRSARDGDVAAVFGLGFPPFLGGPFRYADALGTVALVKQLDHLAAKHGPRFEPAAMLRNMARLGEAFHEAVPAQNNH